MFYSKIEQSTNDLFIVVFSTGHKQRAFSTLKDALAFANEIESKIIEEINAIVSAALAQLDQQELQDDIDGEAPRV